MTKDTFIDSLRRELSILKDSEIDDIVIEYESHINEYMANGLSEEEAINEFGDFSELICGILEAFSINEEYVKKIKKQKQNRDKAQGLFNNIISMFEEILRYFLDFIDKLTSNFLSIISKNGFIKFIFFCVFAIIAIAVLGSLAYKGIIEVIVWFIVIFLLFKKLFLSPSNKTNYQQSQNSNIVNDSHENESKVHYQVPHKNDGLARLVKFMFVIAVIVVVFPFIIGTISVILFCIFSTISLIFFALNTGINVMNILMILVGVLLVFSTTLSVFVKLIRKVVN